MCKSLVGLSHLEGIFLLLDRRAGVAESVEQFSGQRLGHRLALAPAGIGGDPAQRQSDLTLRIDLDRDLISRTADAAALDFELRFDVFQSLSEHVDRSNVLLAFTDNIQSTVNDALRRGLLAAAHDRVDQPRDQRTVELHIGSQLPLRILIDSG